MQNPNVLPSAQPALPQGPEIAPTSSPNEIASKGANSGINAAKVGLLAVTTAIAPIAGVAMLTWFGMDLITGGALSGRRRV